MGDYSFAANGCNRCGDKYGGSEDKKRDSNRDSNRVGGAFTSTGVILVLFILLVIVACACHKW